jgi:putative ABC transport system permease protein
MESLLLDIKYALRGLLRSPGFTFAAIATLALGVGANAAIFSVVDGVLLRPSPLADISRVAMVWETDRKSGTTREPASIPDWRDFQARTRSFDKLAAFSPTEVNYAPGTGDPRRIAALAVSREYFEAIGISPTRGRLLSAEEDAAGGPRGALISQDLWESEYASDPNVTSKSIRINDTEWSIIGVMPRSADFGALQVLRSAAYMRGYADRGGRARVDLWLGLRANPQAPRGNHPIFVLGRLAPGATFAQAHDEMATIAADLERSYPQDNEARGANVEAFDAVVFGPVRPALFVLLGAVALVLIIACVNVANLVMVRAADRVREVTVRAALGAGAGRLARQFLAEGALIAIAGSVLGVLLATAGVDVLVRLAPVSIPRVDAVRVDGRVLAATLVMSVIAAVAFGLIPTAQAWKGNLASMLGGGSGRGASGGRDKRRTRSVLVVSEVAMATMLMVGAGLLIRTLGSLSDVNPGFAASGVLKGEFQLPVSRYPQNFQVFPNWPERVRFHEELSARLKALPGVQDVAIGGANPLDAGFTTSIEVVGREAEASDWPEPSIRTVSASYFPTMRVPVLEGRAFEAGDAPAAPTVVVINQSANERFFGGKNALGQRIALWGQQRTVVGVVGNELIKGLTEPSPPAVYMPLDQAPIASAVLVRTAGDPAAIAPALRQIVRDIDPLLPLFGVEPLVDTIGNTQAQRRFTMVLLVAFAGVALVLAMVGVHGVLSHAVAQRTREIGIRVALGANLRTVRELVFTQSGTLVGAGIGIGLVGALALSQLLQTLLFGVGSRDLATFLVVPVALAAVAAIATWLPARRAMKVDPIVALRAE